MNPIRLQLTLFVPQTQADLFETVRRRYNPEQQALIACHATLCREDELEHLDAVLDNLKNGVYPALTLDFGPIVRFSAGKGLMLSAKGPNEAYHRLRKQILRGLIGEPRLPEPHITLIHPRNATCTDEIFEKTACLDFPRAVTFQEIALIRQENGGVWEVLERFDLI